MTHNMCLPPPPPPHAISITGAAQMWASIALYRNPKPCDALQTARTCSWLELLPRYQYSDFRDFREDAEGLLPHFQPRELDFMAVAPKDEQLGQVAEACSPPVRPGPEQAEKNCPNMVTLWHLENLKIVSLHPKEIIVMWMDETLHHLRNPGMMIPL